MKLEELNVFAARSTWVAIFTALLNVYFLMTGEMPFAAEEAADKVMLAVNAIGVAWVYFERVTGKMKLVKPWAGKS